MDFLNSLKGKRTYIIACLIGLLSAAKFLGWVDDHSFQLFTTLLTSGGLATLRAAVVSERQSPNDEQEQ